MSNKCQPVRWLLRWSLILSFSPCALALPEDRNEPIRISADSAVRDDTLGVTRYEGNVQLQQGSLTISSDIISLSHDTEQASRIIAEGRPARFSQIPAINETRVEASALRIEYDRADDLVRLIGAAQISQEGAIVSGETIDYRVSEQRVRASSGDEASGKRVEVVIPPTAFEEEKE